MIHIDDFDAYCFDLDGTIYVGRQLLPGVKETLAYLQKRQKKVMFITNAPTQTREDCSLVLNDLGISTTPHDIMTASFLAAAYFEEQCEEAKVYIVGEQAIHQEFKRRRLTVTTKPLEATHVLVGLDRTFTYQKLNEAMMAVRNGAKLIVTNPDVACPVVDGFIADTYSLAKAIEVAAGRKIDTVIGKPSAYYVSKLQEKVKLPAHRCLIIGDRLETDILMGNENGFETCLVLTGASTQADIVRTNIQPTYQIQTMADLFCVRSIHKR